MILLFKSDNERSEYILGMFKTSKKKKEYREQAKTLEEILLEANVGIDNITKEQALEIPSVSASVELIANTVAMLPIKLYRDIDGKVTQIKNDSRIKLLNDDTKDTLDAYQFKKAMIQDYLLSGAGYAYINKYRNEIKSLHYVDESAVSVNKNTDPIFKDYDILVNGKTYRPFEFLKLTRKTKDGVTGKGIVDENNEMLTVAYLMLKYEKLLMKTGGNKKGFLQSAKKLTDTAMDALRTAWNKMYRDNTENMIILNEGLAFQEASSTSVELQMNENKETNANEVTKLFGIPATLWDSSSNALYISYIKVCILPILKAIETALNKDMLLEIEKDTDYFAIDTKDLMKADIIQRFQAYEIAIRSGFLQWDDVRYLEDYEPYDLEFIKLGLQDVLFNPKTKEIYTPNTDKTTSIGNSNGGGENDENRSA